MEAVLHWSAESPNHGCLMSPESYLLCFSVKQRSNSLQGNSKSQVLDAPARRAIQRGGVPQTDLPLHLGE
jgi:hypothetical protein